MTARSLQNTVPLPDKICGDSIRLKQVLVNLIKNALKFSFAKPILVLAHYSYEKQILEVHIQDAGQGIHEKSRKRLFKLFGRLNDTDAAGPRDLNEVRVGMGLSICKKIVERANGKIDFFSRGLRQGSTFIFTMKMPLPYD